MRCAWSSSGGKDSLLALWHARRQGHEVATMITMLDETGARSRSHGIDRSLMQAQAHALDLDLRMPAASWKSYEFEFTKALAAVRQTHHEAVVFGDIDLLPHREWEERVCSEANLQAILPLWQRDRRELAMETIELGFKALVVCVDRRYLDAGFCGREYDTRFLADLPKDVDACGENGEFHTFVYAGPLFSHSLQVTVETLEDYVAPAEFGGARYTFARLSQSA